MMTAVRQPWDDAPVLAHCVTPPLALTAGAASVTCLEPTARDKGKEFRRPN